MAAMNLLSTTGVTRDFGGLRAVDHVDFDLPEGQIRALIGPNGAGKTTFVREFLPGDSGIVHFVNADLIAGGLAPLRPEMAALAAGRSRSSRFSACSSM